MSPRISPDRTTRGKASTAVRPPNLLVSPRVSSSAPFCVTEFDDWLSRRGGAGGRRSRGELRHHARGEELERAERLTLAHAAEVHLERRLDLAESLADHRELIDDLVGRPDQRRAVFQDRLGRGADHALDHLLVVGVLRRFVADPRAEGLAEHLDVAFERALESFDRLAVGLGHVTVQRDLDLLGAGWMTGVAPGPPVDA